MPTAAKKGKAPQTEPDPVALAKRRLKPVLEVIAQHAETTALSLRQLAGVCRGDKPDETIAQYRHRITSITGRVRTCRKGNARLLEMLHSLDAAVS